MITRYSMDNSTPENDRIYNLKELSTYSGLSVRSLRSRIHSPSNPLPHYFTGGLVLVRKSEFDQWIEQFRAVKPDRVIPTQFEQKEVDALFQELGIKKIS